RLNNVALSVVQSDLFENLSDRSFDIIAVNPPFFPFAPKKEDEYAWYSGKEYAYFKRLFQQLPHHITEHSIVFMIMADVCDVDYIEQLAGQHELSMKKVYEKRLWWEKEIIFEIRKARKRKPIDSYRE
ncbi:MAG: methyltransferase, partial [Caldithrix sp.]|nr:methyltransferase [Caldithrix sp.]